MKKNLLSLSLLLALCLSFAFTGKAVLKNSDNSSHSFVSEPYKLRKTLHKAKPILEANVLLDSIDPEEQGALFLSGGHAAHIPYADVNPILSGDFTIEFWVKLDQDPGNNDKLLANHGRINGNNTSGIAIEMPDNNTVSAVFGTNTDNWNAINSGDPITVGEWNHIAITAAPNDMIKLYINGELKASNNYDTFTTNQNWDLALGTSTNYGGETISYMDEFRIWDKEKTAEEIQDEMYVSLDSTNTNLMYYFPFNQEDNGDIENIGSESDISYTDASIESSYAPVRDLDDDFRNLVSGNWNVMNDTRNGLYLEDTISDNDSNLIIGKAEGDALLPLLGNTSTDTLYLESPWQLNPLTIEEGTPLVDLTKVFDNLFDADLIAEEYFLLKGNPADTLDILSTGTKNDDLVTFSQIDLDSTEVYLAWIKQGEYQEGAFPVVEESLWKYNDSGADLGTSWKDLAYDDSTWAFGNAVLGYGDGIENTTLDYGTDANNKHITYYLRHTFQVDDASEVGSLLFKVMKDDGVVVYVNGDEAFRLNMPSGTIDYDTYASSAVAGSGEEFWHEVQTSNMLEDGENVIAVELHQASASSSDLRFDMAVDFAPPPIDAVPYPMAYESEWYYLDNGTNLDAENWNELSYNVEMWNRGFGPLGYGDPVNTQISYGPDSGNKYITSYFVKDLEIPDTTVLPDFVEFGLKRDDGAVVYVNGEEVFRDNMPSGTIDYLTTSSTIVDGMDENNYFTHLVPKSVFEEGTNRIAVEVHNRDGQSSDLKFDLYIQDAPDEENDFNCDEPHIGCFTSIIPTGQTNNMIIPEEHRFQLIFKQGDAYTEGSGNVPGNHDYTAYVPIDGSSEIGHLSVNHENTPGGVSIIDLHLDSEEKLWVIDTTQAVDLYNNALATTTRNCSGGTTPWGTVITAEESTNSGDTNGDGYEDVGWLVEIDPITSEVMDYGNGQEKLWAMGRMSHENVVITEDGSTAYYGEDGGTHCVYKFVADTPGDLTSGTVYVLKLDLPLSGNEPSSTTAEWIEVPNETQEDRNNLNAVAGALGGTNFNGVEDCEISPIDGKIYFTAKGRSRTYRFKDDGNTVSEFETFVGGKDYEIETAQGTFTEAWGGGNDNLTFDDKGNLWVLQDGGNNYIWVVRPNHTQNDPKVELFASMPAGSEPTGLTFTPDFKYGFFSVQHPSGGNAPQLDATFDEVTLNASSTVVFSLKENLGIQAPETDFVADEVFVEEGSTVSFTDLSTNNPDSWEWTFEGGNPSTSSEENPTIVYENEGVYTVSLTASNVAGDGEMIKSEYIVVEEEMSVDNPLNESLRIYPNPTHGNIIIGLNESAGEEVTVEVFDLLGRSLKTISETEITGNNQKIELDLSEYTAAEQVLIIQVSIGQNTGRYKVLKTN